MKNSHCAAITLIVTALLSGAGDAIDAAAAATDSADTAHRGAPKRKSGWWEFTDPARHTTQWLCVSDATEAVFSSFDQITQERLMGTRCSKAEFKATAGGWSFDVSCDTGIPASMGGGIATSKGTIIGDLHAAYTIQMKSSQGGATGEGKITAKWTAACPANRKEGDLLLTPDNVFNVLDKKH